jgi:hypothetical protein
MAAPGRAASSSPASAVNVNEYFIPEKVDDLSPLATTSTQLPYSPQPIPEPGSRSRAQRFDQALDFLSAHIGRVRSKKWSPQVRSSAWIYLFDLATCPEQLQRTSDKFLEYVEGGRQFRDQDVTAFVRAWFYPEQVT